MTWRQEHKYIISGADRELLLYRLRTSLMPDPHAVKDGLYQVRTLYFDDPFDDALFASLFGLPEREKYRLRMYNADESFLRLEKKIKRYNGGKKPGVLLSPSECRQLLRGNFLFLNERPESFCQTAYAEARNGALFPRCVVEYTRAAFCCYDGNVRITVDSDVCVTRNTDLFFSPGFAGTPVMENGVCVLEIKYTDFMPDYIPPLLGLGGRSCTAFSKYALSAQYYG